MFLRKFKTCGSLKMRPFANFRVKDTLCRFWGQKLDPNLLRIHIICHMEVLRPPRFELISENVGKILGAK